MFVPLGRKCYLQIVNHLVNRLALGQDMINGLDLWREGLQEGLSVLSAVGSSEGVGP